MVCFHIVLVLHSQGSTYRWDIVSKMKGEGILGNPNWSISSSGRLFTSAVGNEIHPGSSYYLGEQT